MKINTFIELKKKRAVHKSYLGHELLKDTHTVSVSIS
jgi:hypothetical protein